MPQLGSSRESALASTSLGGAELAALTRILDKLRQGDVVHVDPVVVLGAPATTIDPKTAAAAALTDDPVVPVAHTLKPGLYAIITQTCDIARGLEDEPFLHLSPLVPVSPEQWETAAEGRYSVRRFAYPEPIDDLENLVLDVRIVQTAEKTILLEESVRPVASGITEPLRSKLSLWLGTRFARYAFPDELEEHVLRPLREQIRSKRGANSEAGGLVRALEGIWIKYGETPMVTVLLIVNVGRAAADRHLHGDPTAIAGAGQQLLKPIAKKLEKSSSGYQVEADVRSPGQVSAFDLFYDFHQLDVSLA
jgi:hypothetical protein